MMEKTRIYNARNFAMTLLSEDYAKKSKYDFVGSTDGQTAVAKTVCASLKRKLYRRYTDEVYDMAYGCPTRDFEHVFDTDDFKQEYSLFLLENVNDWTIVLSDNCSYIRFINPRTRVRSYRAIENAYNQSMKRTADVDDCKGLSEPTTDIMDFVTVESYFSCELLTSIIDTIDSNDKIEDDRKRLLIDICYLLASGYVQREIVNALDIPNNVCKWCLQTIRRIGRKIIEQ